MSRSKMFPFLLAILINFLFACASNDNSHNKTNDFQDADFEAFFSSPVNEMHIAVLPIQSDVLDSKETEALRLHMEEKLLKQKNYKLIDNENFTEIMHQQDRSLSGFYDEDYAIEIAKLIYANNIVFTTITSINEIIILNIKIINVENGAIINAENFHFPSVDDLVHVFLPEIEKRSSHNSEREDVHSNDSDNNVTFINYASDDFRMSIPMADISISGKDTDWENIESIELSTFDKNAFYESFRVAQDREHIYLRLDVLSNDLLFQDLTDLFFSISPGINDHIGVVNTGIYFEDGHWRAQLYQSIDPAIHGAEWRHGYLPRGYAAVNGFIEIKLKKEWLPNPDTLFIKIGYHDDNLQKDLYWSENFQCTID